MLTSEMCGSQNFGSAMCIPTVCDSNIVVRHLRPYPQPIWSSH